MKLAPCQESLEYTQGNDLATLNRNGLSIFDDFKVNVNDSVRMSKRVHKLSWSKIEGKVKLKLSWSPLEGRFYLGF